MVVSEPMQLYTDPGTNVAIALFEPGYDITYVSFDSDNKMYIKSYYNDLTSPPSDGQARNLYHWYICKYNFSAYLVRN